MVEREKIFYDIAIIGAGPAGLSAAIAIKQGNPNLHVALIEKSSTIGGHIISGAILDPFSLTKLLPDWKKDTNCPVKLAVGRDSYYFLSRNQKYKIFNFLKPKALSNKNCYIISLSKLCRYLAEKAEDLGVEIFPGFAAQHLLFNENGDVCGIELGDFGVDAKGEKTANFMAGAQLYSKYLLVAEGARGSIAKEVIKHYNLDENRESQKYALALKEIWQIDPKHHKLGLVEHFIGFPLQAKTLGGGFIYHIENNKISIGLISYLSYKNPYHSPYNLFETFKKHPLINKILQNGTKLAFGARAISCGGYNAVPNLTFPGGALLGCSAGMVNSARIKGIHNAIESGILCASAIVKDFNAQKPVSAAPKLYEYQKLWQKSIGQELFKARNFVKLWHRFGILIAALDLWLQQLFKISFNLQDKEADFKKLQYAKYFKNHLDIKKQHRNISNDLIYANLSSEPNQPCHLKVKNPILQEESELKLYGGPSMFYYPAAVYEWSSEHKYVINAQNCLHCKTCDIKDPNQNIIWTCPQGGSGPNYQDM